MKNIFKFACLFAALTFGVSTTSCSDSDSDSDAASLTLTASTKNITADGLQVVTFTAKFGGEDVTSVASILCTTPGPTVTAAKFSTTEAGDYSFVASYEGVTSKAVSVKAVEPGTTPEPSKGLGVEIDKSTIEADGVDAATLKITKDGEVVTDNESNIKYVSFSVKETGESQARSNKFTAIANGTYTIVAKYKGTECDNTVTVEAVNRAAYEKYFHLVPIYDITNVQCYYCGVVAEGLEAIPSPYKEHALTLAIHGPYDNKDPWLISAVANDIQNAFGVRGAYPTVIINLDHKLAASADQYSGTGLGTRIREQLLKNPSTCGVKLDTKCENGKVTISVTANPTAARKYDIGCALLLDNQPVTNSSIFTEAHDIVRTISGNYLGMSDKAFTGVADKEETRVFEFNLSDIGEDLEASGGIQNYRAVGFVLCEADGKIRFDNASVCQLGESNDYRLN